MESPKLIIILVITVLMVLSVPLLAFTPASGNQTIYSGTTWFTDTGGWPGGAYQNNENYTITLYPASAGYSVYIDIWDFDSEAGYDRLSIFNGPSTGYTMLAQWHGSITSMGGRQTYTSTASDGSLTIWWYTDGSVVRDGWAAYVGLIKTAPSAPTMYAPVGVGTTYFTASWSNSSASDYYLEIATNDTFSSMIWQGWTGNVTSYGFNSGSPGTTYYLRIRAYNGYWSGYSNTAQATTIPNAPTASGATNIGATSLRANWSGSSGASRYYVEISTDNGFGSYQSYDAGSGTLYDFSSLIGFTNYYYRVRAYNAGGYSAYSSTISTRTLVANPYNVSATPATISPGQSSNLIATSPNCNIRWFTSASGGEAIGTSASGANFSVSPSQTTTYYAEAYSGSSGISTLSSILSSFNSNYANITSQIPNRYDFAMDGPQGVNSNYINDGGNDMYDGGNYLATNLQNQMYYSDNVINYANFGSGGAYFTRYVPGMFILVADMTNINHFQITGNNGADGGGSIDGTMLTVTVNNITYNCYLKRVYSATDPSINQMIIIPQNNNASHWYDTNTDSSGHHVTNINATNRLYYLLYAGSGGYYIDNSNATNIATAFLTQVGAGSAENVSSVRTAVSVNIRNVPNAASMDAPQNTATEVSISQKLFWSAPIGGDLPSSYNIYFGKDNPPQTLVENVPTSQNEYDPGSLEYNQIYYWQIVPLNETGAAINCPVWNFTTTDIFIVTNLDPVIPYPMEPEAIIIPIVQISGVAGTFMPTIQTSWSPLGNPFGNVGLAISISNAPLSGRTIIIDPDLGFIPYALMYRLNKTGSWFQVLQQHDWRVDYVYFTIPASKADEDLEILFPSSEDQTLAINLSSFAAIWTGGSSVKLNWVVASETDHSGYNVLRSDTRFITDATRINFALISDGTSHGTEVHYSYRDMEIGSAGTYFYWLESICLSGIAEYYGPVAVNVSEGQPSVPEIPQFTMLKAAFPNPFNPTVFFSYSLDKASEVAIEVFNTRGQKVWNHTETHSVAGSYRVCWDAIDFSGTLLPTGVYYYRMTAGNYQAIRKITLKK